MLVHRRIDRESGHAAVDQRVTISRRFRDELHTDRLRCTGTVFNEDLLAQDFGQSATDGARHQVTEAAGVGEDDTDGFAPALQALRMPQQSQ